MARKNDAIGVEISREAQQCIDRQVAGGPKCHVCKVCSEDFFFDQICSEVEGTYDGEPRQ